MRTYLGIDPGVSGGLAVVYADGSVCSVEKMPDTEADLLLAFTSQPISRAVLERVWSSPGWGHVGAFKFGMSYGALRMALTAAKIPFEEVLPQKWQQALGCLTGGDKAITKRRAQALFPSLSSGITHATADALLLAEYCRRVGMRIYGEEARTFVGGQKGGGKTARALALEVEREAQGPVSARRYSPDPA